MILDINARKTEQTLLQLFEPQQAGSLSHYRQLLAKMEQQHGDLNHGKAGVLGRISSAFYLQTQGSNNVEYLIMKEIDSLKTSLAFKVLELAGLTSDNSQQASQQSLLLGQKRKVEGKVEDLNSQIEKALRMSMIDPSSQRQEIKQLEQTIADNTRLIEGLKAGGRDKRVLALEAKIEEVGKKIGMLEKLLKELQEARQKTDVPVPKK
jgi:hypothetical protein